MSRLAQCGRPPCSAGGFHVWLPVAQTAPMCPWGVSGLLPKPEVTAQLVFQSLWNPQRRERVWWGQEEQGPLAFRLGSEVLLPVWAKQGRALVSSSSQGSQQYRI